MSSPNDAPARRSIDVAQLRRLGHLLAPYRVHLGVALLATFASGLVQVAFPLLTRTLFNEAFAAIGGDPSQVRDPGWTSAPGWIAAILIASFAVQAVFNYLRVWLLGIVGEGVVADLRKRVFAHLLTLSPTFFLRRKTGEITARLTGDVATVQALVSTALAQFVQQAVTLLAGAVALFYIHATLTALMLAVVPAVIVSGALFGRRLRRLSKELQDRLAAANADAEEAIANVRVVQSFTGEDLEERRYGRGIDDAFDFAKRRVRTRAAFIPSISFAMFTGITIVLWYGGRQVLEGTLAPGDLIAFLLLTLFVAGSVATFTGLFAQVQEGLGASRRVFELLSERSDLVVTPEPVTLPSRARTVTFDGVWFRYPTATTESGPSVDANVDARDDGAPPWVLEGIDLEVLPGTVVALVGPSGAGKSTLAALIPRFFDPTRGRVMLDGVDLRDMDPAEVRKAIAIVPQETQLFSGSVFENVRYGRPDAGRDEVAAACEAAHALAFVERLPEGFETRVGERGLRLSGGQRQRIAIARALLKDPSVLVLDEATSSLDGESEALVQDALERLMVGRTSIVIAHRLSTIRRADAIVVLEGGTIKQVGRHDDLVATDGIYRTLFDTQFRRLTSVATS